MALGGESSATVYLLRAPDSTPLYYAFHSSGAVWVVNVISPILLGLLQKKREIETFKIRGAVVQMCLPSCCSAGG
jgi:hypothetical protein